MTFYTNDVGTVTGGIRHKILTGHRFRDASPSFVVTAGEDAA